MKLLMLLALVAPQDSATVVASWDAVPGASGYEWSAGSDNYTWQLAGTVPAPTATFTRVRPMQVPDSAYFCVKPTSDVKPSPANTCAAFVIPAAQAPPDTVPLAPVANLQVVVTIPSDTTPPDTTPPGGVWGYTTFEQYGSTAEFLADCAGWGNCAEDTQLTGPKGGMYIDTAVAYPGLTRSLRLDFVNQGDQSLYRQRRLDYPGWGEREIWVEIAWRFSTNFTTCNSAWICDYKMIFGRLANPNHDGFRFFNKTFKFGETYPKPTGTAYVIQDFDEAADGTEFPGTANLNLYDGQWHIFRFHWKVAQGTGAAEVWIDGARLTPCTAASDFCEPSSPGKDTGLDIGDHVHSFLVIGGQKDRGRTSGTESIWYGYIKTWNTDPGW